MLIIIVFYPQGAVDGLLVQVNYVIHPLPRGVATPGDGRP